MIPKPKVAAGQPTDSSTEVEADAGEYDFAPAPTRPPAAAARTVAPPSSAEKIDAAPASVVPDDLATQVSLPPQRKGLTPEERACAEELDRPSLMRDWVVPSILIATGVGLRFFETMSLSASDEMSRCRLAQLSARWRSNSH
jgi:hypothetical protein